MAEIATAARPYAEALFRAAGSALDETQSWLNALLPVGAEPQVLEFADNPRVQPHQVFDLIVGAVNAPLPDMARNFLRTLIANGRLRALPAIAQQFRALRNAHIGQSEAVVETAFALDDATLTDLGTTLEQRFGRKLRLQQQVRVDLIGGVRVVVGDEVLDYSVKARLEQMKAALTA